MQIDAAGNDTELFGSQHYSDGYWWCARLDLSREEKGPPASDIGMFLRFALPPGVARAGSGLVGAAAVGPVMHFTLSVGTARRGGEPTWDAGSCSVRYISARPLYKGDGSSSLRGWTRHPFSEIMPDGSPIHRSNFRSPGSPILHDGKLLVKCSIRFDPIY